MKISHKVSNNIFNILYEWRMFFKCLTNEAAARERQLCKKETFLLTWNTQKTHTHTHTHTERERERGREEHRETAEKKLLGLISQVLTKCCCAWFMSVFCVSVFVCVGESVYWRVCGCVLTRNLYTPNCVMNPSGSLFNKHIHTDTQTHRHTHTLTYTHTQTHNLESKSLQKAERFIIKGLCVCLCKKVANFLPICQNLLGLAMRMFYTHTHTHKHTHTQTHTHTHKHTGTHREMRGKVFLQSCHLQCLHMLRIFPQRLFAKCNQRDFPDRNWNFKFNLDLILI